MATIQERINNWREESILNAEQVRDSVAILWRNKGYRELQKQLIFRGRNNLFQNEVYRNIVANQERYTLPFNSGDVNIQDFASVIALEVAYDIDQKGNLVYAKCTQVDSSERTEQQRQNQPTTAPRYRFDGKDGIVLFPTPKKSVTSGMYLHYNFIKIDIPITTNDTELDVPRYFLDCIDLYMDFRQAQVRKMENAQYYYQQFVKNFQDTIGDINSRDSRPVQQTMNRGELYPLM